MEVIENFYDTIFTHIDLPFLPSAIESVLHQYIKKILMILVDSAIDAMVATLKDVGVFTKESIEVQTEKQKPYTDLDLATIQKRAKLVRENENFCKNIQIINREAAEEKEQTKTQEDLLPEETLYEKFIPNKDTALFKTWHSSSWEDKLRLLDKFQDKRCSWFGQKIIYQEAPQILPPDLYKNIKSEIARRILSKNKEKWQTVNMAYTEIDYLRDQASNRDDEEELKKLDEINQFIMSIEKKYEIA